jgi:hypothetical protein
MVLISFLVKDSQDQADGLGYCPDCDHEYTEAQVENIDHDRAPVSYISECPNCHSDRERALYWCEVPPLHAPRDCEAFHE